MTKWPMLRILQFVGAAALFALGAFLAVTLRGDPIALAADFALVAIGFLQAGLASLVAPGQRESDHVPNTAMGPSDPAVEGVLDHIVGAVRRFLLFQSDYQEKLSGLSAGLSQLPSRNEVQEIVVRLMNRNMEMQAKVGDLSRELDDSHQQILSLRNNVVEIDRTTLKDPLTKLGNRRFFEQTLRDEFVRAGAAGEGLCLARADLDSFGAVNERFGHPIGDQLLRLFADLLAQHTRGVGFAARYGGDDFTLLFPNLEIERASAIVERIRRELETKRWVVAAKGDRLGAVTASFGVALMAATDTPRKLVERAHAKLLEAKAAGRNRVVVEQQDAAASESVSTI